MFLTSADLTGGNESVRVITLGSSSGVKIFSTGRWGQVGITIVNESSEPATVRATVHLKTDPNLRFGRDVWVPGQSKRTTSIPVPLTEDGSDRNSFAVDGAQYFVFFCIAILVCGLALTARQRLEHLSWLAALAAVLATAFLIVLGQSHRGEVPPTTANFEFLNVSPQTGDYTASGALAMFQPDQVRADFQITETRIDPQLPELSGEIREMIWTDGSHWQWTETRLPPGVMMLWTDSAGTLPVPVRAQASLGPQGLQGVFNSHGLHRLTDDAGEAQPDALDDAASPARDDHTSVAVGVVKPTSGTALIAGADCARDSAQIKKLVGYMPDGFGSYDNMRVREYLDFFGAAFGIPRRERIRRIAEVLEITNSTYMQDRYVESLSHGMQQRVGIARTLLHDPEVLIFDEPANGLDPQTRIEMRELLLRLAADGKTLIVTSHILPELSRICDQVAIITQGRLRASGSLDEIMRNLSQRRTIEVQLPGGEDVSAAEPKLRAQLDATETVVASPAEAILLMLAATLPG